MTADTNEALDALVAELIEDTTLVQNLLGKRTADLLTEMAAKLAEAEAELAQVKADADARVAAAYEWAAATLDTHGGGVVNEALGQKLCCSGYHCGCMGADVGTFLQHLIRGLTPADADAALSRIRADARRQALQEAADTAKAVADGLIEARDVAAGGALDAHHAILARIEAEQ